MELPRKNKLGFFEIRFESVGGLGANLAGQVLASALVLGQGFNGAHFSTYGSEKKGSPGRHGLVVRQARLFRLRQIPERLSVELAL